MFTTGMLTTFPANFFSFGGPQSNFGFLNWPSAVKTLRTPGLEDTTGTLSYRLSRAASDSDDFFWYHQYPGEPPQFLLYISGFVNNRTSESLGSDKRFSTELTEEKTRVDLKISSAAVTDSALYYCALRPTVTGNTDSLYKNLLSTKHSSISP